MAKSEEDVKAPRVVIVGGGFAGLAAARTLADEEVSITLLDRANHHLFQPLLYQVAMAGLSPADIAVPIRTVLRRQRNVTVLLAEVTDVDLDAKRVTIDDGSAVGFDYLIVAAGAKTNFFGQDETLGKHALGLKTLDEALDIRRRVLCAFEAAEREASADVRKRLLTFVIIGGGATGVEMAGALSDLARTVLADDFRAINPAEARVLLLERADRLLPGFDERLAKKAQSQLKELGVEVRLGAAVEEISRSSVTVVSEVIATATVVWTAGVRGTELTSALSDDLDRSARVPVQPDLSLAGHPCIFVCGDMARFVPKGSDTPLPGLAPVASQQGRHAADNVRRLLRKKATRPFAYVDRGAMATIGRSRAVAQAFGGRVRLTGLPAWFAWLFVHIWFLIDFRNRVSVFLNWFWNYVTYRRGARLITGQRPWELAEHLAEPESLRLPEMETEKTP